MKNRKNAFISHIHEADERLPALKNLLAKHDLDVRDSSINSDKPNKAKSAIKYKILAPRIGLAGCIACSSDARHVQE